PGEVVEHRDEAAPHRRGRGLGAPGRGQQPPHPRDGVVDGGSPVLPHHQLGLGDQAEGGEQDQRLGDVGRDPGVVDDALRRGRLGGGFGGSGDGPRPGGRGRGRGEGGARGGGGGAGGGACGCAI